jgi:hypothetical protein
MGAAPETLSGLYAAHSLLRDFDLDLSEFYYEDVRLKYGGIKHDGKIYAIDPPASSLTLVPFLFPEREVTPWQMKKRAKWVNDEVASRIAALCILVLSIWLLQLGSVPRALLAVAIIALATSHWTIIGAGVWNQTAAVLWLTGGLLLWWMANGRAELFPVAAAFLAMATLCRPTMLPATLLIVLDTCLQRRGRAIVLSTVTVVSTIGVLGLLANWEIYGSLLGGRAQVIAEISHTHGVSSYWSFSPLSYAGLLISPSRGLFVYSPVLLFALPGLAHSLRSGSAPTLRLMTAAGLCTFAMYGFVATWWGGWVYGPRYMADILPFFGLWLTQSPLPNRWRSLWAGLFALTLVWSVWVQHLGASTYPCGWNTSPAQIDKAHSRLWDVQDTQIRRCWVRREYRGVRERETP